MRPEKVVNPYGSTAGANSGDFHLYRQTRAREMERMKQLTEEEKERMKDMEFQNKIKRDREEVEKKTEKKRKKRQKQKEAKLRRKMLAKAGVKLDGPDSEEDEEEGDLNDFVVLASEEEAIKVESAASADAEKRVSAESAKAEESTKDASGPTTKEAPAPPFANDGSFLETMKKQMEAKGGRNEKTGAS